MSETPVRVHRQVVVMDPLGLRLRPAAKLVVLAKSFRSDIRILCQGSSADAKSLLDLAVLAPGCGTTLDLVAHGPDADEALAALAEVIQTGLDGSVGPAVVAA